MQPFQCDLQPEIQQAHRTTHTPCRTQRRNRLTSKRSKPQPLHTGGTFHRRLQPLYTEKRKVSCSVFLPNTSSMQHSCSHHNAFCGMTWLTRMYLRTQQQSMATIMQPLHECIVMWCQVSHHSLTPPFIECILVWCKVSHRPWSGKSHPQLGRLRFSEVQPETSLKLLGPCHASWCPLFAMIPGVLNEISQWDSIISSTIKRWHRQTCMFIMFARIGSIWQYSSRSTCPSMWLSKIQQKRWL